MNNPVRFFWAAVALVALLLAGCPAEDGTETTDEAVAEGHEGHDHAEHADHAKGHRSVFHAEGVDSAIENTDDGVVVTYTSENAEQVTELQESAAKKAEGGAHEGCKHDCPCKWEGVSKSFENLDNGVKVTLATEDADQVTKIQEAMAKKVEGGGCGGHGKGHDAHADKPWAILHAKSVTRGAENLDNGVKMTFTAGCPHKQGLLQEAGPALVEYLASDEAKTAHADSSFHMEGVTATSENVDGGVAITFVSDDPAMATKLQEHAALKAEAEEAEEKGCGGCDEHADEA